MEILSASYHLTIEVGLTTFVGKQTKYLEEKEGGLVSLIWKNQAHDPNPIVESIRTYGRPPRFL